jgi:transcriptional regulator with XRE-family HTH domain
VRQLREQRGWDRSNLARRAKLSQSYLGRLERGFYKTVKQTTLQKLADAFEVSTPHLLSGTAPTIDERIAALMNRHPDLQAAFLNASYRLDDAGIELLISSIEGSLRFYETQKKSPVKPPK